MTTITTPNAMVYYTTGDVINLTSKTGKKKFSLSELQSIVDGRIQSSKLEKNTHIIYNEEGILLGLRINPHFPQFRGNVIVLEKKYY